MTRWAALARRLGRALGSEPEHALPGDPVRRLPRARPSDVLPPEEYVSKLSAAAGRLRDPGYTLRQFHGTPPSSRRCGSIWASASTGEVKQNSDSPSAYDSARATALTDDGSGAAMRGGSAAGAPSAAAAATGRPATSSGRSEEEYRRTFGALFSVYWLLRIDCLSAEVGGLGGQLGFSFGVEGRAGAHRAPSGFTERRRATMR